MSFECLKFKWAVQEQLSEEQVSMSWQELRAHYDKVLASSPFQQPKLRDKYQQMLEPPRDKGDYAPIDYRDLVGRISESMRKDKLASVEESRETYPSSLPHGNDL